MGTSSTGRQASAECLTRSVGYYGVFRLGLCSTLVVLTQKDRVWIFRSMLLIFTQKGGAAQCHVITFLPLFWACWLIIIFLGSFTSWLLYNRFAVSISKIVFHNTKFNFAGVILHLDLGIWAYHIFTGLREKDRAGKMLISTTHTLSTSSCTYIYMSSVRACVYP